MTTAPLTIRVRLDQDTLCYLEDAGVDRDAAQQIAVDAIRTQFPDAIVDVAETTSFGSVHAARYAADGTLDWEEGDGQVETLVREVVACAHENAVMGADAGQG